MANILLTGSNGYIGKRLLISLAKQKHFIYCCVRDKSRFTIPKLFKQQIKVIELDFLKFSTLSIIPQDIDVAFYLIHSLSNKFTSNYDDLEQQCTKNFTEKLKETQIKQVIYLSAISNDTKLSKHLKSRKNVEYELAKASFNLTVFRAGIIIGSGSASFEIIRDLVEKLPIMIAPKWLNTRSQSIAIRDVISFLTQAILKHEVYNKIFDIGCSDILTYKQMLLGYAKIRNLKRKIYTTRLISPIISSYWLYFITSTSFPLAQNLVKGMNSEIICKKSNINKILKINPINYKDALIKAIDKVQNNEVISSWKDSVSSDIKNHHFSEFIKVPKFGCYKIREVKSYKSKKEIINKIWSIGGDKGWYYADILWKIRGFLDLFFGGVGLKRGRKNSQNLECGDALDFWRVIYANKSEGRLILFAEMKVPGEAWLEFNLKEKILTQTATFRPKGLMGIIYWYGLLLFHKIVFRGLAKSLVK